MAKRASQHGHRTGRPRLPLCIDLAVSIQGFNPQEEVVMNDINSDLRKLMLGNGFKGILLLMFLHYGFFSFVIHLIGLVTDFGKPVFGGPWGVLLFSCGMASVWLRWPCGSRSENSN